MNNRNERPRALLPASAAVGVQRAVRTWINTCDRLPSSAGTVSFEDLQADETGMCIATVQAPAYAAKYILGGYRAEYRFRIVYRVQPSDDSDMLDAVEALTNIADWCETTTPPELTGAATTHITRNTDAAILAAYEDGSNDYAVDLTLTWEVF